MADDKIEIELIVDESGANQSVDRLTDSAVRSAEEMGNAFTAQLISAFELIRVDAIRTGVFIQQALVGSAATAFTSFVALSQAAATRLRTTFSAAIANALNQTSFVNFISGLQNDFAALSSTFTRSLANTQSVATFNLLGRTVSDLNGALQRSSRLFDGIIDKVAQIREQLVTVRNEVTGTLPGDFIDVDFSVDTDVFTDAFNEIRDQASSLGEEVSEDFRSAFRAFGNFARTQFGRVRNQIEGIDRALKDAFNPRNFGRLFRGLSRQIFNFRNLLLGTVAGVGIGVFISRITELASVQDDAINALNQSLASAGTFTAQASQEFQNFANELERTTRFGDEVILQQVALARNFTRTNAEARRLVSAAVDLSEATNLTLDSAVLNLGRSLSGLSGELGEAVSQVRVLTTEQLKAGEAINVIARRFGGAALSALNTFSGAVAQARNALGTVLETLGQRITRSPVIVGLARAFNELFIGINKDLQTTAFNFDDFFDSLIQGFIDFGTSAIRIIQRINNFIDDQRAVLLNTRIAWRELTLAIQEFSAQNSVLSALRPEAVQQRLEEQVLETKNEIQLLNEELFNLVDSNNAANSSFERLISGLETVRKTYLRSVEAVRAEGIGKEFQNNFGDGADAAEEEILRLRRNIELLRVDATVAVGETFRGDNSDIFDENDNLFRDIGDAGKRELEDLTGRLQSFVQTTRQVGQQVREAVVNGIGNAITRGIESFIQAIASGENALSAFGKSILAVFGDLAIQLGQFFITYGVAKTFFDNPLIPGGQLIAFGAGLVALGAVLKAFSGTGGSSAPASSVTPPLADLNPGNGGSGPGDLNGRQTEVSVRIEGNLVDPEGAAIAIADLLKDEGFQNSVVA